MRRGDRITLPVTRPSQITSRKGEELGARSLAVDGNNLNLVYTASAVPEPGSFALIAGLFTLGIVGTRRRARSSK